MLAAPIGDSFEEHAQFLLATQLEEVQGSASAPDDSRARKVRVAFILGMTRLLRIVHTAENIYKNATRIDKILL